MTTNTTMSGYYPPGVTGNEPEISGDATFESLCETISKDWADHGLSDCDLAIIWSIGLAAFLDVRKWGVKFPHD